MKSLVGPQTEKPYLSQERINELLLSLSLTELIRNYLTGYEVKTIGKELLVYPGLMTLYRFHCPTMKLDIAWLLVRPKDGMLKLKMVAGLNNLELIPVSHLSHLESKGLKWMKLWDQESSTPGALLIYPSSLNIQEIDPGIEKPHNLVASLGKEVTNIGIKYLDMLEQISTKLSEGTSGAVKEGLRTDEGTFWPGYPPYSPNP